uniref:Deoxynucleotidyltransferase, terminal n=1 Tax=Sphaeramia orbicularis TaxID=375764 RepID=A0A673C8Y0_9TELE
AILPRARKRSKPAEAGVPRHEEVKFEDIRLYLVERKMGSSRRGFLTQLARSKGFIVEDILSNDVTHVVSEDNQPSPLWTWLRGRGLKDLPRMHVVDISWFTESMRASRPVAVETRHRIQLFLPFKVNSTCLGLKMSLRTGQVRVRVNLNPNPIPKLGLGSVNLDKSTNPLPTDVHKRKFRKLSNAELGVNFQNVLFFFLLFFF